MLRTYLTYPHQIPHMLLSFTFHAKFISLSFSLLKSKEARQGKEARETEREREHIGKRKVAKEVATAVGGGGALTLSLFPKFPIKTQTSQNNDLQTHHRQRRLKPSLRRRQWLPPQLLPSPFLLFILLRLLPRLLLLPIPPLLLPRPPRPRRHPGDSPRREAEEAGVRPPAGGRAVHGHQPHHRLLRRRVPQHPHDLHRRERQQGGDQVRGVPVHRHVPRHSPRPRRRALILPAGTQRAADRDRHRRRPGQPAAGRRRRFGERRFVERSGRIAGRR